MPAENPVSKALGIRCQDDHPSPGFEKSTPLPQEGQAVGHVFKNVAYGDDVEAAFGKSRLVKRGLPDIEPAIEPGFSGGLRVGFDPGDLPSQITHGRHKPPIPASDVKKLFSRLAS